MQKKERGFSKVLKGVVSSDKMDKSVTVSIVNTVRHGTYSKFVKRSKKYYAHDEENKCKVGDVVLIRESKPYSKMKKWRVTQILETEQI